MELILTCVIGLVIGAVLGFLIGKNKAGDPSALLAEKDASWKRMLDEKQSSFDRALADKQSSFDRALADKSEAFDRTLNDRSHAYEEALAEKERSYREAMAEKERVNREAMETQAANNARMIAALEKRFDETVKRMQEELQNVTNRMLKERQTEFETSSREGVARILEPLQENIKQMREAVSVNTKQQAEAGGRFDESIKNLLTQSEAARISADRLADALRHGGKVQGDWGETVLTELLESQGLKEGIHFDTQTAMTDAVGNALLSSANARLIPDVVLHLDKTRDVIIDAKVSLTAYLDYMNAETEEVRNLALRQHVDSIWKHVRELAAKDYSSYVRPPKTRMGYVIMFVPNTAALFLATNQNPDLWRKAMEMNVYIADEQTLYAALKIINLTWTQIMQAENHEKVFSLADEMLTRVRQFAERFVAMGKAIDDAKRRYDEAYAKLDDRGQSIPVTCNKLIKLGAKQEKKKGVPEELLGVFSEDQAGELPLEE